MKKIEAHASVDVAQTNEVSGGGLVHWFKGAARKAILAAVPALSAFWLAPGAQARAAETTHLVEEKAHVEVGAERTAEAKEERETLDQIEVTVKEPTKCTEGRYIALSRKQREKLGLEQPEEPGQVVEVLNEAGESLGLYMVGLGHTSLEEDLDSCAASGIPEGTKIKVRKVGNVEVRNIPTILNTSYHIDQTEGKPEDEVSKIAERQAKVAKYHESFPSETLNDRESYITVPTALLAAAGLRPEGDSKTILPLHTMTVEWEGKEYPVTVVPAGSTIGFNEKASQKFGVSDSELKSLHVSVEPGKLILKK